MVLDHTGSSQWGWQQNSMITIDDNMHVVYNPEFYLMKHFSYFIKKGARYIQSTDENSVIFLNPYNKLVIISYNPNAQAIAKEYSINKKKISTSIDPKTLATFEVQL